MNHENLVLSNELIKVELRGAIRYPGLEPRHLIHYNIPGYHFTERNRSMDIDGGVGLCSKNSIKFRPPRLPRGILCLIPGTIYYPKHSYYVRSKR